MERDTAVERASDRLSMDIVETAAYSSGSVERHP